MSIVVPSPVVTVQDGTSTPVVPNIGVSVVVGNTYKIALNNTAGVQRWTLKCVYSSSPTGTVQLTPVSGGYTFTSSTSGVGFIFTSLVSGGSTTDKSFMFAVYVRDVKEPALVFPSNISDIQILLSEMVTIPVSIRIGATAYVNEPVWHIDAVNGSDLNPGGTGHPLKTFAELQSRWGKLSVLNPIGGVLRVFIDSDLPQSDPITFQNFLPTGNNLRITGAKKVLATGTVNQIADDDTLHSGGGIAANIKAQTLSTGTLAGFVGCMIHVTSGPASGSRCWIERDLGSGKVQIGRWMVGAENPDEADGDGFVVPGLSPSHGDSFEILDFPNVYPGSMMVGEGGGAGFVGAFFLLEQLHIQCGVGVGLFAWPSVLGGSAFGGVANCIIDGGSTALNINGTSGNNQFRATLDFITGELDHLGGSFLGQLNPFGSNADYPGALRVERGANWQADGGIHFVGDVTNGYTADIVMLGNTFIGSSLAFFNTDQGISSLQGGFVSSTTFGQFGIFGEAPIWGNGNAQAMTFDIGSQMSFTTFQNGPAANDILGPNITNTFDDNGFIFTGTEESAVVYNPTNFAPVMVATSKWSDFNVLYSAGTPGYLIQTNVLDAHDTGAIASASNPNYGCRIAIRTVTFTP